MKRNEFIKRSLQYGTMTCLGISMLLNRKLFASLKDYDETTDSEDGYLKLFSWIPKVLEQDLSKKYIVNGNEYKILNQLKSEWGNTDTSVLLKGLSEKYGEDAFKTVEDFIKPSIKQYWAERGKEEARDGSEVKDFIKALWKQTGENGFIFSIGEENNIFRAQVTKCPYYQLAEETNTHEWIYHLACITDYFMTPAFSKEIGFERTKTLVQGNESCDHTYYYKSKVKKKDSLLGYCGLYCGACPGYQFTQITKPVDYSKTNSYEVCEGCNSGYIAGWCADCQIKNCNRERGSRVCLDCEDYPCRKMDNFINDERYPYHKQVDKKMRLYKEIGLDEWLILQEKGIKCKNCGTVFHFFQHTCIKCGNTV